MDHHQITALAVSIAKLVSHGHIIKLGGVNLRARSESCFRVWLDDESSPEDHPTAVLAAQAFVKHCKRRKLYPYGSQPTRLSAAG